MSRDDSSWSFATGLFFGALTGAALASLFTPRSGPQNREAVRDQSLVLKSRVDEATLSARARVNEATTTARSSASASAATLKGTVNRVSHTVQTVRERVNDAVEQVSDATTGAVDRVSQAAASVTQRSQDKLDTTAQRTQQAIDTAATTTQAAVESAIPGPQVEQRGKARIYSTTPDTAQPDDSMAKQAAAMIDQGVDQTAARAKQTLDQVEQAVAQATQSTDTPTVSGETLVESTPESQMIATDPVPIDVTDTPAQLPEPVVLEVLEPQDEVDLVLDADIDTSTPAETVQPAQGTQPLPDLRSGQTEPLNQPLAEQVSGQTEPLTQPLEEQLQQLDDVTTQQTLDTAADDADKAVKLGRNQKGKRYRR